MDNTLVSEKLILVQNAWIDRIKSSQTQSMMMLCNDSKSKYGFVSTKEHTPGPGNGIPQGFSCPPKPSDRCWFLQS